jgi:hypothetical protein
VHQAREECYGLHDKASVERGVRPCAECIEDIGSLSQVLCRLGSQLIVYHKKQARLCEGVDTKWSEKVSSTVACTDAWTSTSCYKKNG